MSCYKLERLVCRGKPIFKEVEDLYVLIMEGSENEKNVREQLRKYPLCKNMWLQWNKGFKKCKKEYVDGTQNDLFHANVNIFKKCKKSRVFILEEDFIIYPEILEASKNIDYFLKNENPEFFTFGSIILGKEEKYGDFMKIINKFGTQACIYNNIASEKVINFYEHHKHKTIDIDVYTTSFLSMYTYKEPLIIQVFNETQNMENWAKEQPEYIYKIFNPFIRNFVKITNLDKKECAIHVFRLIYNIAYNENKYFNKLDEFSKLIKLLFYS